MKVYSDFSTNEWLISAIIYVNHDNIFHIARVHASERRCSTLTGRCRPNWFRLAFVQQKWERHPSNLIKQPVNLLSSCYSVWNRSREHHQTHCSQSITRKHDIKQHLIAVNAQVRFHTPALFSNMCITGWRTYIWVYIHLLLVHVLGNSVSRLLMPISLLWSGSRGKGERIPVSRCSRPIRYLKNMDNGLYMCLRSYEIDRHE
jgi:hypothetical protein